MKNKILKIFLILGVLFFLVVGAVFAFIIYSLPSAKNIGSAFVESKSQNKIDAKNEKLVAVNNLLSNDQTAVKLESSDISSQEQSIKEKKIEHSRKALLNLTDPDIPLSDFCLSLKNAKSGSLNATEFNTEVQTSADDVKDSGPRIQALKPLLRTMFREPKMKELILEAQTAVENKEENFWQKAAFYSKAAMAFQALIANKSELESVSDRSYLFYKMNTLVSVHPELLNDDRLQKFCSDTENAFNTNQPVQFDQEKKNFERILAELNVKPDEIKYDPNYKTKFDFTLDSQSMRMNGGWLEELISDGKAKTK